MIRGIICLFLFCTSLPIFATLSVPITSDAALLISGETGAILYAKNAQKVLFPASITKVATALYVLKFHKDKLSCLRCVAKKEALVAITAQAKKNSNYRQPAYWLQPDASHIGIKVGEELYLKDLMAAMLVASANDAANVIAESVEKDIPAFMEKANLYLKKIGCRHTHFNNPHGLHHPDHKTTALDMAIIAKEAMQEPLFREWVKLSTVTLPQTNLTPERHLVQTNLLMRKGSYHYKKAIGIKTGTTSQAGKTLIAAAQDKERYLLAVVLGSQTNEERYLDAAKLFDAAFQEQKMRYNFLKAGAQKFSKKIKHGKTPLTTHLPEPLFYDHYPSEKRPLRVKLEWQLPPLPIKKDTPVGRVYVIDDHDQLLTEVPLLAQESVTPTLYFRAKNWIFAKKYLLLALIGGVVLLGLALMRSRRSRRQYLS